jgi:uncharacterized lipoprotein YddW (UPF0748 family)
MLLGVLLAACATPAPAPAPAPVPLEEAADEEVEEPVVDPVVVPAPRDEVRGVWVTRWTFRTPQDIDTLLDDAQRAGFTHVFLQVRGTFDAFYRSSHEPWARELSGTLGKDPGWDPLQHAIEGAHARGLELHAWANVYALWQGKGTPKSVGIPHPFTAHPDWSIADKGGATTSAKLSYRFASPGNPEVADHLVAVFDELDERYDIDGLHLDYVRSPGRDWGYDAPSLAAAGQVEDFDAWRRDAIVSTVSRIAEAVDAPLTAATWGLHDDRWRWGLAGASGYGAYFQDAHGMLNKGILDASAPMIYWPVGATKGHKLDFATLVEDHVAHRGPGQIWAGIDAHKLSVEESLACLEAARAADADGVVFFEHKAVRDKGLLDVLAEGPFATPRGLPPRAPSAPPSGDAEQ